MTKSTIMSTIMGKAYEYACICAIHETVSKIRPVEITRNSSLDIAKECFEQISESDKADMIKSATAGVGIIIQMEPRITEDGNDKLTLSLQADNIAKSGDIRDIIIIRRSIKWEIGISVKHNHAALKHSRLSARIDFGDLWFGTPCSKQYFDSINPIFVKLNDLKQQNKPWNSLQNKDDSIYMPILNAFMAEFMDLFAKYNQKITTGIITYLLGSAGKDYYKLIHYNNHKTRILPFNVSGTLNQPSKTQKPQIKIPKISLPTKIIDLSYKDGSKTTLILTMNNGWAISFRIHNASTIVEPSLKFDIQLVGQPADLFYIDTEW